MPQNDDVIFTSSTLKPPPFTPIHPHKPPFHQTLANHVTNFIDALLTRRLASESIPDSPLLCSASLSLSHHNKPPPILGSASLSLSQPSDGGSETPASQQKGQLPASRYDEERVLISEVLVRDKDGEELERKDLEAEALTALKACRANSALTVREVQEDVHRIIDSGYFNSCMPVAVDTRDGIRLVFQV